MPATRRTCFHCDRTDYLNTFIVNGAERHVCDDHTHHYNHCQSCNHQTTEALSPVVTISPSSRRRITRDWCHNCINSSSFNCESCAISYDTRRIPSFNYQEEDYCESCFNDLESNDYDDDDDNHEEPVRRNGRLAPLVYDYSANPIEFTGIRPQPGKLNLGFEIEVEIGSRGSRASSDYDEALQRYYERANGRAIAKHDGSISYGYELVSAPMPLPDICGLAQDIFHDGLHPSINAGAHSVGMHVHMSRAVLTRPRMSKMITFTQAYANREFMNFIAGRNLSENHFCRNNQRMSWRDVIGSGRGTAGHKFSKFVKTFNKSVSSNREHDNTETDGRRYSALNFERAHTVEARIFQSANRADRVKANLQFCAALVEFCIDGTRPMSHYGTPTHFVKFVSERKEYSDLASLFTNTTWLSTPIEPDLRSIRYVAERSDRSSSREGRPVPWYELIATPAETTAAPEDMAWLALCANNATVVRRAQQAVGF